MNKSRTLHPSYSNLEDHEGSISTYWIVTLYSFRSVCGNTYEGVKAQRCVNFYLFFPIPGKESS